MAKRRNRTLSAPAETHREKRDQSLMVLSRVMDRFDTALSRGSCKAAFHELTLAHSARAGAITHHLSSGDSMPDKLSDLSARLRAADARFTRTCKITKR